MFPFVGGACWPFFFFFFKCFCFNGVDEGTKNLSILCSGYGINALVTRSRLLILM